MNHDRAPNRRRALLGLMLLPTVAGASAVLSGCRSPAERTSTAGAWGGWSISLLCHYMVDGSSRHRADLDMLDRSTTGLRICS